MLLPGIGSDAAGAGDISQTADGPRVLDGQDRRAGEPIMHDAVGERQFGDLGKVGRDRPQ